MALLLNTGNTVSRSYSIVKPSPTHPIYPTECGDKTANLFDKNNLTYGFMNSDGTISPHATFVLSDYIPLDNGVSFSATFSGSKTIIYAVYDSNHNYVSGSRTVKNTSSFSIAAQSGVYVVLNFSSESADLSTVMINDGTTALPYEPYGYKIPILSNDTTYPVYLAEPLRAIGDYVDIISSSGVNTKMTDAHIFNGTESLSHQRAYIKQTNCLLVCALTEANIENRFAYNSHFITYNGNPQVANVECSGYNPSAMYAKYYYFRVEFSTIGVTAENTDTEISNAFKAWLTSQYNAGTPVIVYSQAATTTESFTAPTLPTSGTAQTFDVSTTLKPSEVSLTYHGWHEHEDTKFTT